MHQRKVREVFEEESLELLQRPCSKRRKYSNTQTTTTTTHDVEAGCERPFCHFLWKHSREFIFVIIPILRLDGEEVNINDGRIELKVEIFENRVKAYLTIREDDERFYEEVFLDSSLSVTILAKGSNWRVRNNKFLVLEFKKQDVNDDVHYPFILPLKIEHNSNNVNTDLEYVIRPSNPPLQDEMHTEWFQCLVQDILECHKEYEMLKKDLISTLAIHSTLCNPEKAALKYNQALEMPELSDAYELYREAADLGHAQARYAFANLCLLENDNPFNIERSEDLALYYLKLASFQNNHPKATIKIATMYLKGIGNEQRNISKAKIFYVESIIQSGDPKPMLQLGNINEEMASHTENETECELLRKKAMSWYRLAVNRGFTNACISASLLLHKSKTKDLEASMTFFKIGRVFSGVVDESVQRKEKLASIEESEDLYIPHWSPRKTIRSVKSVASLKSKPLRLELSSTQNTNSLHKLERDEIVDLIGFSPIDSSKFHLPGEDVLLKNQVKILQVDKLALETKIEEITDQYEKKVALMKLEINNLRAELQKYQNEAAFHAREMNDIATMREAFQQQELKIAIHHALLSLKIRANINIELPPLVDRAVEENVKMEEISSWFKRQTEGR